MRGQASAFDGKQNTGLLPFKADGTFGDVTNATINEVEYKKAANINMPNLSAEALASGYVYVPTIAGTWPTGLCIRYLADFNDKKGGALPAVLSKANSISIERGKILKLDDQTDNIHFNYYVSVDGGGDGLTSGNPMTLAKMQEMFTASKSATYSSYVLQGTTFNLAAGTYDLASTLTIPQANAAYSATIKGASAATTILSGGKARSVMSVSDNTHIYLKDLTITQGKAQVGAGISVSLTANTTDKTFVLDVENCIFLSNASTNVGGAVGANKSAAAGLVRFNNCRFESNSASTSGAVAAEVGGKVAFMFNNCFMKGCTTNGAGGVVLHLGNSAARLALNNCTINAGTSQRDGCSAIDNIGYTVIANTTIWSSKSIGNYGSIANGASVENGSTIINSFIKNGKAGETTNYPAFYLSSDYYQNIQYSLYSGLTGSAKNATVTQNSTDVGTSLTYSSSANVNKTINGVKLEGYNLVWSDNETAFGDFKCPTLQQVQNAISGNPGVGDLFLDWLETIPDALTTDMFGVARPEECSCPGALQFTGAPTANQ